MVTEKFARREEILTGMLEQRQASLAEHESGRKLLSDEVSSRWSWLFIGYLRAFTKDEYRVLLIKSSLTFLTGAYSTQ